MTSKVIREGPEHKNPGQLKEIIISCDQIDCDSRVNDELIRTHGGLKEMGWTIDPHEQGLRHYCPDHSH